MLIEKPSYVGLESVLAVAAGACGAALKDEPFRAIAEWLPEAAPQTPEDWYCLLKREGEWRHYWPKFEQLADAWMNSAANPGATVENYAFLQAMLWSLANIPGMPVAASVKQHFAEFCMRAAAPNLPWRRHFRHRSPHYKELCLVATLTRLPAGEAVFDVIWLARTWLLKIHPLDIPSLLIQVWRLGRTGPLLSPHTNTWRANTLILQKEEMQRSLYRMAQTLAADPSLKGLMADSWLNSEVTGEAFPHLAWMRSIFTDEGAYAVDLEMASSDAGFLTGSAKRRQLYESGEFRPRRTLILWDRASMLSWAARHPEFSDSPEIIRAARNTALSCRRIARPARPPRRANALNRRFEAAKYLDRRPKVYVLASLVVPSLAVGLPVLLAGGLLPGVGAISAAFAVCWFFQYFCFQ